MSELLVLLSDLDSNVYKLNCNQSDSVSEIPNQFSSSNSNTRHLTKSDEKKKSTFLDLTLIIGSWEG